jgi:hypothetical protein
MKMTNIYSPRPPNIMTNKWFLGLITATSFGAAILLGTSPVAAQVVYAPSASAPISPYTPILAAMEPPGCPLYGNGQWAFINNGWMWCPPTIGYSSPTGYGYGSSIGYGYSSPTGYGYGAPTGYGYSSPVGYGYGSPVGYGYSSPVGYGYGYGSPVAYGTGTSLTGSPIFDMVLGLTASSLIASQFQPYGQQAYYPGYPPYAPGYPNSGYPGYGLGYPVGYQGYPGYGGGNTYIKNVYRRNIYRYNELTGIARDQRRVAVLRAGGGNRAEIARLNRRIEINQHRVAWDRAAEQRDRSRIVTRQNMTHNGPISVSRNRIAAPHMATTHNVALHMSAPRMETPRMSAPRMNAPRMSAPSAPRGGRAAAQPNAGSRHRPRA